MKIIKKLFYPMKECKAIFIESIVTFLLLGFLFLLQSFIEVNIESKYSYLSDYSIYEENDLLLKGNEIKDLDRISSDKLRQYKGVLNDDNIRSEIVYSLTLKIKSENTYSSFNMYYSNEIEEVFGYTSIETFEVDSIEGKGIYISHYIAEKYKINLGEFINIYNDAYESIKLRVVGIIKNKSEDINWRIYCDDISLFDLNLEEENIYINYLFLCSKKIDNEKLIKFTETKDFTIRSKQIYINEQKGNFDNFFKLSSVYIYLSTIIMGVSLFILTIIKSIKLMDVSYIEKIYYKRQINFNLQFLIKNTTIICLGFFISFIFLSITKGICLLYNGYSLIISVNFYLLSLFEMIIILLASLVSWIIFDKNNNKIKK